MLTKSEIRRNHFRQLIVDAAIKLFEAQGIDNTPVAQIIREAGIAHKTFFNHFPTKYDLIVYIAESYAKGADQVFEEACRKHRDPYKRMEFAYGVMGVAVENLSGVAREMVTDVLLRIPKDTHKDLEYRYSLERFVTAIIEQADEKGKLLPKVNKVYAVNIITAIYTANLFRWASVDNYPMKKHLIGELKMIKPVIFA